MNGLRSILPRLAAALCSGFLLFTVSSVVFSENNDQQDHQTTQVAFQANDQGSSSPFTRQAGDGEAEAEDGIVRHDHKGILQTTQLDYSRLHSASFSTKWTGHVRTLPVVQHLPVLFQRLLI